jgi:hypothetical protein
MACIVVGDTYPIRMPYESPSRDHPGWAVTIPADPAPRIACVDAPGLATIAAKLRRPPRHRPFLARQAPRMLAPRGKPRALRCPIDVLNPTGGRSRNQGSSLDYRCGCGARCRGVASKSVPTYTMLREVAATRRGELSSAQPQLGAGITRSPDSAL